LFIVQNPRDAEKAEIEFNNLCALGVSSEAGGEN
jgi:hypothetical protein